MSRTPKLGEVWMSELERACIDADPDDRGRYGWKWYDAAGSAWKDYGSTEGLTPPKAEPPERLKAEPWLAVTRDGGCSMSLNSTAEMALNRHSAYVGAVNVLTGEWVPRD